jgi:hypothetical protein
MAIVYAWLGNLPEWWLLLLFTGTAALFSLTMTATVRRITKGRRGQSHNDVMGLVFGACSIMYAVLVGFVILDVYNQYVDADRDTTSEAATLVTLYADAQRYPDPPRSAMQEAVRQYTRSVVEDEFASMRRGERSSVTATRLKQLYLLNSMLKSGDPNVMQLTERFNAKIDDITLLREERLRASRPTLPWMFWFVLILGGVVTISMAASLSMEHAIHQLVGSFLLGIMIGAVLFMILALDRPFNGATAIGPSAFQRSMHAYALIDEANRRPAADAGLSSAAAQRPAAASGSPDVVRPDRSPVL